MKAIYDITPNGDLSMKKVNGNYIVENSDFVHFDGMVQKWARKYFKAMKGKNVSKDESISILADTIEDVEQEFRIALFRAIEAFPDKDKAIEDLDVMVPWIQTSLRNAYHEYLGHVWADSRGQSVKHAAGAEADYYFEGEWSEEEQ